MGNILLKKSCKKWGREKVSDLFLSCKKALYNVKASAQHLSINKFRYGSTWTFNKNFFYYFRLLIQKYDQFRFCESVSDPYPPHFVYYFSIKIFLVLYSVNWPNFIVWLPLLLEILGNICIVIICCPVCDVIKVEINHSFLTKPFFYMTKKSGQKCTYLKSEKNF